MAKIIEENERIKRKYLGYLVGAKGRDEKTANKVAAAIARFEKSTNYKPFKKFHVDQAGKFKAHLAACKNGRTKRPLSHSTIDAELRIVKAFIFWLAGQPGYKSRISYSDAEYFTNSLKSARIAHTRRPMHYPTLLQCKRAFEAMPDDTPDQMRDKASFSFFLLTGARVKAASTLRLKHINVADNYVYQDARDVATKGAKSIRTEFYPVDQIYYDYFKRWVTYLYETALFGPEDPLFPKPRMGLDENKALANLGLSRKPYASSTKLYSVVKTAFSNVQMHGYTPHNFRRTHGALASQFCDTPEKIKAWSMNFGHEDVMTTISAYVPVSMERQIELLREMRGTRLE